MIPIRNRRGLMRRAGSADSGTRRILEERPPIRVREVPDFSVASYSPLAWHDFFIGTIGAAAALTGLLFVAISINLEQILKYPQLPGRAAGTLGILVSALIVSGSHWHRGKVTVSLVSRSLPLAPSWLCRPFGWPTERGRPVNRWPGRSNTWPRCCSRASS